ncbi:hypothetical protein BDV41DRAFT_127312 [Aspergillus transmontanensis]|uniref:Secreted protein n=1 Tax=Aspergillus transmontanensis TaxID=1034304 RepID=A0A5N6W767_9EURO|nr:hypothetical protein BDV41DRAFT_127312 [Aspergillus transmontanensis]
MLWFIFLSITLGPGLGFLFRTFQPQNSVLPHSESVRSCSVRSRGTFHFPIATTPSTAYKLQFLQIEVPDVKGAENRDYNRWGEC